MSYCIAVISTAGCMILWFRNVYKEISCKKRELVLAKKEVDIHLNCYLKVQGSSEEQIARKMLDTSYMIYNENVKSYNRVLKKPMNRLPRLIMGFRYIGEEGLL